VDASGNKTKYNVTIKNNFAFFETDHFSIYTLTTEPEDIQTPPDVSEDNLTSPNTGDNRNVMSGVVIMMVAVVVLITTMCIGKRKSKKI
jgi:hypothetical protein